MESEEYDLAVQELGIDTQTGLGEEQWGSWQTDWVGEQVLDSFTSTSTRNLGRRSVGQLGREGGRIAIGGITRRSHPSIVIGNARVTTTSTFNDILQTTQQSREGIQMKVTPVDTSEVIGEKIVSRDVIPYMRRRNIEITTHRMKPKTQFYVFFDDVDVTSFSTPKLIEINMTSGVFQAGETVKSGDFSFRLATPNHKEGPYNAPTKVLTSNPYNIAAGISTVYSTSSTLLNVDTFSLATQVQGEFFGHAKKGMLLVGQTSGAEATILSLIHI